MAFSDSNDKLLLVYSNPIARLASNKTVTLPIKWDGGTASVLVDLPDTAYPLVITFGISAQIPKSKSEFLQSIFQNFRRLPGSSKDKDKDSDSDSSSSSSEGEEKDSTRQKRTPGRLNVCNIFQ